MSGPWSRWVVAGLVDDEDSLLAEGARKLAGEDRVVDLTVAPGEVRAHVVGTGGREYDPVVTTAPLPARVWAAIVEEAAGRPEIEAAVAGREQSAHLHHELAADWGEPLVPRSRSIRSSCTCSQHGHGRCQHVAALAYAFAAAIDEDPSLLLRWRGCAPVAPGESLPPPPEPVVREDAWTAGPLPELDPPRPLPVGTVLMRLGPSGINAGGRDLAELLRQAYERFAAR